MQSRSLGVVRKKNEAGAAENWEHSYVVYTNVSTCTSASGSDAESSSATRSETGGEACSKASIETRTGAPGLDAYLPERMGCDRGKDTERPGNAVCVSLLPDIASRVGPGAWVPQDAPRAVGEAAPRGGIANRCRVR